MAAVTSDLKRISLPSRLRWKGDCRDSLSVCMTLADRISSLPGIVTEDHDATLPCSVDVYLQAPVAPARKRRPAILFCSIGREGVDVYGLSSWERHQVTLRGWGRIRGQGMRLHLPRDSEELEVCWELLERAFRSLTEASASSRPIRAGWPYDLPRFSRTSLQ